MSDKRQETSADIIAEMRGARTKFPFVYLMGEPDTPEVIDLRTKEITEPRKINIRRVTVKELADRMESALKRESGNYAKLREVVGDLLYMAERYAGRTPATETVIFDPETKKEVRTINYYAVIEKARSILSGGDEEPKGKKEQNHER